MQEISNTVQINAPIETVFGALINVQNNVHWIKSVVSVEMIDEPPMREGFRFRETGGFMGVNTTDEKVVVAFRPPHEFGFKGQFLDNGTHYQLEMVDEDVTDVTVTLSGTPPRGTPQFVQRQVLKQAGNRIAEDLARLGRLLENNE